MDLTNKVVVVTGGSAGLGEQICYEALNKGGRRCLRPQN